MFGMKPLFIMHGLKTNHIWCILWFTVNYQMNAVSLHGRVQRQQVGSSSYSPGPYERSIKLQRAGDDQRQVTCAMSFRI